MKNNNTFGNNIQENVSKVENLIVNKTSYRDGVVAFHSLLDYVRLNGELAKIDLPLVRYHEARCYRKKFISTYGERKTEQKYVGLFSDSLALPRKAGPLVEETYPFLLQNRINEAGSESRLQIHCIRGATLPGILNEMQNVDKVSTIANIIQAGIVDCAPRIFLEHDLRIVKAVCDRSVVDRLIRLAGTHRAALLKDPETHVYTPLPDFLECLQQILNLHQELGVRLFLVNILTPIQKGRPNRGSLGVNVQRYNQAILELSRKMTFQLIDIDKLVWLRNDAVDCFAADGYHLSPLGHRVFSESIFRPLAHNLS